jgi:hypothetical protein
MVIRKKSGAIATKRGRHWSLIGGSMGAEGRIIADSMMPHICVRSSRREACGAGRQADAITNRLSATDRLSETLFYTAINQALHPLCVGPQTAVCNPGY